MSVPVEEPLRRVRMSWEEFLALPDHPRAEWVDGEAVLQVTPPVWGHGSTQARVCALLLEHFPQGHVAVEAFLQLPRNRVRLPDVMMIAQPPGADGWVRTAPLQVVEVLSPSTRTEDTVGKYAEYLEGGAEHYWILDPESVTLDAWRNVGVDGVRAWESMLHLDAGHPVGEVEVAGVAVGLDLDVLLRR